MKNKEGGFTIVELLIVIVIIGILAALVIVAYTGITNRANATKAKTNAQAIQKKAEALYANASVYPTLTTGFSGDIGSLPTGVSLLTGSQTLGASTVGSVMDGKTYVEYQTCASGQGYQVYYWDFAATSNQRTLAGSGGTQTPCVVPAT